MINHYSKFPKDTACYSCSGCCRCEVATFRGVAICHSYRSAEVKNKLIDDVIDKFEQERMRRRL